MPRSIKIVHWYSVHLQKPRQSASVLVSEVLHILNGHRLEYTEGIRTILKQCVTDAATVDGSAIAEYLRVHPEEVDLASETDTWREDLIRYGLDELTNGSSDPMR